MDTEIEDYIDKNNTDELDDFKFELTAWDVFQDSVAIAFTFVGLVANVIIIYMIARNVRMRTKTNLLIMNFAINDALFLLTNMHFLSSLFELLGSIELVSTYHNCVLHTLDVAFQFNEVIFVLILVSNTLIKSKRIQINRLLFITYGFIVGNFLMHMVLCHYDIWPLLYLMCFVLFMVILGVVLFKEINSCYKIWYKKDPLSERTRFRFNIGRIYVWSWFSTFSFYIMEWDIPGRMFFYTLAMHSFMVSMYILIYIVIADKNFKICMLNLLKCKGAGDYDVDATITFAEDLSDGEPDNNQVNINFNGNDTQMRATPVHDISTIRVS